MFVALLLAPLAFADVAAGIAAPCQASMPRLAQPADGEVGVPVDAMPAVAFNRSDCGSGDYTLTLTTADDGAIVATTTGSVVTGLLELDAGALVPLTAYTLQIDSVAGDVERSFVSFTTGSDPTVAGSRVPEVKELEASWEDGTGLTRLSAVVRYGDEAGADLIARWSFGAEAAATSEEQVRVESPGADRTGDAVGAASTQRPPPDLCLSAGVREYDGSWTDGEPLCADVVDESSFTCSTAGAGASALGVVLAGLVAARRRSRG